ncbi:MAG: dethiobiotin synthetase [Glaciecola sp.]|jgi:dethiobiotin synthetase
MKKIIVAGIGTEIGKTVCSAILCEALKADYWKPVQAGELENSDSHTISSLVSNPEIIIHPESYRLTNPMSPHAAASLDGIAIDISTISIPESKKNMVIELAGGLFVPLNNNSLNIDWIEKSGLPVILVSQYYLGSINHSLLSWEALKNRNIPMLGFIFNGKKVQSTFDIIMKYTGEKCLLEVDQEPTLNKNIIADYARKFEL